MTANFIVDNRSSDISHTGGKARNLARLDQLGFPVPPWFAVSADAFLEFRANNQLDLRIAQVLMTLSPDSPPSQFESASATIRQAFADCAFPADCAHALAAACRERFAAADLLAVRSSAKDEDQADASFAGLHDSLLFVNPAEVAAAVKTVWASAYSSRALSFRLRHRRAFDADAVAIGVVVQKMITSTASGVMFTVNPNSGNPHEIVINTVWGAGEGLVGAGFDADSAVVRKSDLSTEIILAAKTERMVFDSVRKNGLRREAVEPERQNIPTLSENQISELARCGIRIENHCRRPQDIEFCFDEAGKLFILQTRPVTTVADFGPAAGNRLIWDNANIIESYSGVTSPLTFSFIRHAYTIVYHCFADVMGIPHETVRQKRFVFQNMLGLFQGQVYYNLINWYRLIQLFPGFNYNKGYMEAMMGVKDKVDLPDDTKPDSFCKRYFVELPKLLKLVATISFHFRRLSGLANRFNAHFHHHYDHWLKLDFRAMPPHELMQLYRDMEEQLLWNWKTPIINDFYVMIYYGVLKKCCQKWSADHDGTLQNDLICGEGGIESTEPTKLLVAIAREIKRNPYACNLFLSATPDQLHHRIPTDPQLTAIYASVKHYLALYGFRCMNELKLEEPSLKENPQFLYQILKNYLTLDEAVLDPGRQETNEKRIRTAAEAKAFAHFSLFSPRRHLFRWMLNNARKGVKNRENMRFARTRIYGLLRELFCAVGHQFAEANIINAPADIFYLTMDEIWDYLKGTAVTTNLRGLVELRKTEFNTWRQTPPPADRFETYGPAYFRNSFTKWTPKPKVRTQPGELQGTGCCPGVVRRKIKILRSPSENLALNGEILVAGRTDPGWVPLYPAISGLLIERGSILSHSAIVAREMGIPTIVGIPDLLATLKPGQTVELDGQTGIVRVIPD